MLSPAQLPLLWLKFWSFEAPLNLVLYFVSLNTAFLQLFSLTLFFRTFFKPIKNEYRDGLVGFSIAMGMVVKTILIIVDLTILAVLIAGEIIILVLFLALPFIILLVLFSDFVIPLGGYAPIMAGLLFLLVCIIFFEDCLMKLKPKKTIAVNSDGKKEDSFTRQALRSVSASHTKTIVSRLLSESCVKWMMTKLGSTKPEIPLVEISKESLIDQAFEIAREAGGQFVTTMDVFAAYVLLSEPTTHFIFEKKLKLQDIGHLVSWARFDFPDEENPMPTRVHFWGSGIGDAVVYGWTPETKKYTTDITGTSLSEKPVFAGRKKEYAQAIEVMSKQENNNVLILGESGSGRSTMVQLLAYDSYVGVLPHSISHKRFLQLSVGNLLAGISNQGELEERLIAVFEELVHAGNITLYIPNIENILGASTFATDLSGTIFSYIHDSRLTIVATTTPSLYKNLAEKKSEFFDQFGVVTLTQPEPDDAFEMLLEKANSIERKYRVSISYKAILTTLQYAHRYMPDKILPGSGISLLIDAASKASSVKKNVVEEEDILTLLTQKTAIPVGQPDEKEKETLLHFEDKLHERVIGQDEAVFGISEAFRRLRAGLVASNRPISFLFLGPTGVGKTETAKALAEVYFHGEDKIIRFDMSEYQSVDAMKRLLGSSPGEGDERGELTDRVHDHPYCLVLLDEFEKAHPTIRDLFLQILEDGRLTDNKGRTVSFANTIIIATSNAGSEFIREEVQKGMAVDSSFQKRLIDLLQTQGIFKPELLNRFDSTVVFTPLRPEDVVQIVHLLLKSVMTRMDEQDITISFDEKVISKITAEGVDQQFGARPLRRYIQNGIEDILAQHLLRGEINRGDVLAVTVNEAGQVMVTRTSS